MSSLKKLKTTSDGSDSQMKRSFDTRVCNDLCEVLLRYLSIKDRFRLECVSKQFQRNIYLSQLKLKVHPSVIEDKQNTISELLTKSKGPRSLFAPNYWNQIDIKRLTAVLKKCPNIVEISLFSSNAFQMIRNVDEVLQTITNYCNRLTKFKFIPIELTSDTINDFFGKYCHQIKEVSITDHNNNSIAFCKAFVENCSNSFTLKTHHLTTLITERGDKSKHYLMDTYKTDISTFESYPDLFATKLSHLWLNLFHIKSDKALRLLSSSTRFKSLKHLKIGLNLNEIKGIKDWIPIFKSIANECTLLESFEFSFQANQKLPENSFEVFKHFKSLKSFSIISNGYFGYQSFSLEFLKQLKQLSHLKLKLSQISNEFFNNIDSIVPNLIKLEIISCNNLSDNNLNLISRLKHLQSLKIMSCSPPLIGQSFDTINDMTLKLKRLKQIHFHSMDTTFLPEVLKEVLEINAKVDIRFINCNKTLFT